MLLRHEGFRRLCQARKLLEVIDDPSPAIEEIARELGISPFHFIRQFEALFGLTPHQYRVRARLERARVLLAGPERSVTEICFDVGFSSLGSFSALFAKRFGESPSAYRRRVHGADLTPGCLSLMRAPADRSFREA